MKNIQHVYMVEIECKIPIEGDLVKVSNRIGLYEDIDDAIDAMLMNDDSDIKIEDVKKELSCRGMAETTWGPTKIGAEIAKDVHVTISEERLILKSTKGS